MNSQSVQYDTRDQKASKEVNRKQLFMKSCSCMCVCFEWKSGFASLFFSALLCTEQKVKRAALIYTRG